MLLIFVFTAALIGVAVWLYYLLIVPKRQAAYRNLMGGAAPGDRTLASGSPARGAAALDPESKEYQQLKNLSKEKIKQKDKYTLEELFFHAGMFSPKAKRDFQRMRLLVPFITTPLCAYAFGRFAGMDMGIVGGVLGLLIGLQIPRSILERKIARRGEEIMYYLPLVIEQIAIGVSSSLDVGPCIQRVVKMADERDTHNVVTELLRHVQYYIRSGASLEEALDEIGKKSGHTHLKHVFMSLAQVAKHGGEITRQLQELADSVASQRETAIEAKIKKLELEATGPVALVFLGFLIILLVGFAIQIRDAFG